MVIGSVGVVVVDRNRMMGSLIPHELLLYSNRWETIPRGGMSVICRHRATAGVPYCSGLYTLVLCQMSEFLDTRVVH
jgi:hypothetical protein